MWKPQEKQQSIWNNMCLGHELDPQVFNHSLILVNVLPKRAYNHNPNTQGKTGEKMAAGYQSKRIKSKQPMVLCWTYGHASNKIIPL